MLAQQPAGDPVRGKAIYLGKGDCQSCHRVNGAGLRLGLDVIAPGQRRRIDALVEGGKRGARLCLGIAAMLLVAAFLEAFWSSMATLPAALMYVVAGVLWSLVFAWLAFGGRGLRDAD